RIVTGSVSACFKRHPSQGEFSPTAKPLGFGVEAMRIHSREAGPELMGVGLLLALATVCRAEEPVRMSESFPAGYQYHVSCRVEISGTLALPAEKGQTS